MAIRGVKPKPTGQKILEGNFRKDRVNAAEPKPTGPPVAPDWLKGVALEEWCRIAPALELQGVATDWDAVALAAYCSAVADLVESERVLADEGYTVQTKTGVARHPMSVVKTQALATIRQYSAEFGLTPSSRTRIHATQPGGDGAKKSGFFDAS